MPRGAAGGARGGAEFGTGLARVGRLKDFASAARRVVVARGFARGAAARAIGQGFRAVHFVEMRFVDFGGSTPTPTAFSGRPSPQGGGNWSTAALAWSS